MKREYKLYQVDAFTKEKFKGNPAGVVLDAEGLTDIEMQMIAREMNLSETAFIFKPEIENHFCKIRYFTPKVEVPFCGHATIASHHILARRNLMEDCEYFQESNIGRVKINIHKKESFYNITLNLDQIEVGAIVTDQVKIDILKALGIEDSDLNPGLPMQITSTGHSKVIIPIQTLETLHQLSPDFNALIGISKNIKCNGYFPIVLNPLQGKVYTTHGRMFAPIVGINEDPVTGNANGPLGVYLAHHKLINPEAGILSFKAIQGEAMGRTGSMKVNVTIDKTGHPVLVSLTGTAITVFETVLTI